MTNSTVDATNSQVAANLVDFAQQIEAANPGTTVDVSGIDDLAIGLLGTRNNSLSVTGSIIIGDVGILSGGTTEMSVTGGSRIQGNLTFGGAAVASVNFDNSTLVGAVTTGAGSTSNMTLTDSTWNLTGNSNVTNLTNDPSVIAFAPPVGDPTLLSSYRTLTVTNYVGAGGQIHLNTYLAGDGSPSDRLLINGGLATGNTPWLQLTQAAAVR